MNITIGIIKMNADLKVFAKTLSNFIASDLNTAQVYCNMPVSPFWRAGPIAREGGW